MLNKFKVSLCGKSGHKDSHGGWVESEPQFIKYMYVDIQPYSTQLLLNQYGYNIQVNKRIFINTSDPDVKIGSIFQYVNKQGVTENYEVKVIPWDDGFMEVACIGI